MSTKTPGWLRKLQVIYSVTLAIWAVATGYVAYAESQVGFGSSFFGSSGVVWLALFAPGLIYLTVASFRWAAKDAEAAKKSARTIFTVQRATGIPALIGAIVGLVPAAINIPFLFTLAPHDQLSNAPTMVPWAMVYVYTVTYLLVGSVQRGLKARALAEAAPDEAQQTTETAPAGDEPKPAVPKLPIAPNLFLVGSILLAYFTVQVEFTAFQLARNGELTDLAAPGFEFSFYQFVDLTMGNAAGVVILIFALINWPRDGSRFRKVTTPLLAVLSLAVVPGVIATTVVGFAGVSPEAVERNEKALVSSNWINNLVEAGNPDGFTEVSDFLDCGAENCIYDPDSTVTFVRLGDPQSNAFDVCATTVAYAFASGATAWSIAPDYSRIPLESAEDPAANAMCVATLADYPQLIQPNGIDSAVFRFVGIGDVPFQMDLMEIQTGTASPDPGLFNYRFTVSTTFVPDDLLPGQDQLSDGTHELNDLLTTIGQARLANPDIDPNNATLIREALRNYQYDIPVTPVVDTDGKIRLIEIQQSDDVEPMCVSIAPWDEEFFGVPDPGTGYGVGSAESLQDLKDYPSFGITTRGSCTP
jgi:hypothetical protein